MRKCIYILLGLLPLFASCEKSAGRMPLEGQPVYLSVSLPDGSQTKVPYEGSAPTTSNPLNVDVWASTTEKVFLHKLDPSTGRPLDGKNNTTGNEVAIHTSGHFQSGEPQLLSQAVYPPPRQGAEGSYTADPVFFVAMYPQSIDGRSWSTANGTQAAYTFTGCEDVMFAPQVSGAYDTQEQNQVVKNSPELAFRHLLTRFTVKMGIVLEEGEKLLDVQNAWGRVKDIKIQAYNSQGGNVEALNTVTVDLSKGASFNYGNDIAFSYKNAQGAVASAIGSSMDFYSLGTNGKFPGSNGFLLTEQIDSVAYVMCAPVVATAGDYEYVITVETENRGEQTIELDLMKPAASGTGTDLFTGSTRGKHFGITLKFKKGSAIATVATVTDWKNGGYGTGEIEDL